MIGVMMNEDSKLLIEENEKLKKDIKNIEAYNEQLVAYYKELQDQVEMYKEGLKVSEEKINKLNTKIDAYKEIIKVIIKENK